MIKYLKSLCLILMIGIMAGQTADSLFEKGVVAYDAGEYNQAETLFQQVVSIDDMNAPAHFYIAQLMFRWGKMDETQHHMLQAIESEPKNQEYRDEFDRLKEINTLMGDGARSMSGVRFDEAFETYRIVLEKVPFYGEAAYSMGLAKFREKNFDEAVIHFQKALEINPDHENARAALTNVAKKAFNEGNTAYKRRNLEEAISQYEAVLSIDDQFYQAYYQLGVIKTKMQNISGAISSYKKALEINPDFYKGWFALGIAKNRANDSEGAFLAFQKTVDVHPGYAKAYAEMGKIHLDNKAYSEAEDILKTAIQVNPKYAKSYELLGIIYIEQNLIDEAITNLELSATFKPKNAMVWYRLAQTYNKLADCENAIRCAREATDRKKSFGGGWVELGIAEWCGGRGSKTAALNALEKARNDRTWRKMAEYEMDKVKNPEKYID